MNHDDGNTIPTDWELTETDTAPNGATVYFYSAPDHE